MEISDSNRSRARKPQCSMLMGLLIGAMFSLIAMRRRRGRRQRCHSGFAPSWNWRDHFLPLLYGGLGFVVPIGRCSTTSPGWSADRVRDDLIRRVDERLEPVQRRAG